jgi:hypothetical protein
MSVLTEVTHVILPLTDKAFDAYVEIYSGEAVPAMQRHGYEILGGWKWSSGRVGNDLMLIRFESHAERQKAEASLLGDTALLNRLRAKLEKAGVRISEEIKFTEPLSYATEKRLKFALESSNSSSPRQFQLTRTIVPPRKALEVNELLSQVVDQTEEFGTEQLVHAYRTTVGIRGEITHLWTRATADLRYRPNLNEPAASLEWREGISEETVVLLNPLPYSRLQ